MINVLIDKIIVDAPCVVVEVVSRVDAGTGEDDVLSTSAVELSDVDCELDWVDDVVEDVVEDEVESLFESVDVESDDVVLDGPVDEVVDSVVVDSVVVGSTIKSKKTSNDSMLVFCQSRITFAFDL